MQTGDSEAWLCPFRGGPGLWPPLGAPAPPAGMAASPCGQLNSGPRDVAVRRAGEP